ncbi:MAG: hypothetical protein NZ534_12260, partial [Bacteroidia bacterium]|nr:hypothetical protein [Bacteroidia bacterium]
NLEGFPEGVRYLRQTLFKRRSVPLVSDVFYADEPYKTAVETYLEPYLNHYVVQDKATALAAIESLKASVKGRVNFFVLQWMNDEPAVQTYRDERLTYALSVVEYSPEYEALAQKLLGGVYLFNAESVVFEEFPEAVALVHFSGSPIYRRGAVGGGSVGLFEGKRLGRAQNLEKNRRQIEELQAAADQIRAEIEQIERRAESLKNDPADSVVAEAYEAKVKKAQELAVLQSRMQNAADRAGRFARRIQEIELELAQLNQSVQDRSLECERLADECDRLFAQEERERKDLRAKQNAFEDLQRRCNQENIALINLQNSVRALKTEYKAGREKIENAAQDAQAAQKQEQELRQEIAALERQAFDDGDKLSALYEALSADEREIAMRRDEIAALKNAAKQTEA